MKIEKILLIIVFAIAIFLRFYKLDTIPPGLYIDEVSSGYNGYAILQTGKDEYGQKYPLWFKAFGEYKMPVLIYSMATSMAIFGKNEFAVRFPSAFAGVLTVIVVYFLTKKIFYNSRSIFEIKNWKLEIPEVTALLLAISPWHIQFSRGGFDATIALFFFLLASLLLVYYWTNHKVFYLLTSFFFFLLTLYTYNAYRVTTFAMLFIVIAVLIIKKGISRKHILLAVLLLFIMSFPILQFSTSQEGLLRFEQTSAFVEYPTTSFFDKLITYPIVFLKNYISYFSFQYLFNFGDGIGRHQIPGFGELYRWQLPFLLLGLYYILRSKNKFFKLIVIVFLLISPLAAAIARPSPHALRSLPMVIPIIILIAYGMSVFFHKNFRFLKYIAVCILFTAIFELSFYLHYYYVHYPNVNVLDWGAGYKELVQKTTFHSQKYDYIVIDHHLGLFGIYFHFYNDSLKPISASDSWEKPKMWANKKVLYIRPYYGRDTSEKLIDTVYLQNNNHDIFAQFWEI